MTTPWQAKVAAARMAGPVFDQRAYMDWHGDVRFYPGMRACLFGDCWFKSEVPERDCVTRGDYRLPDTEARALWAKRPKGMK